MRFLLNEIGGPSVARSSRPVQPACGQLAYVNAGTVPDASPVRWHEQMRNRSLATREFNHKIFGSTVFQRGARELIHCTIMVHDDQNAPF
jgi:hypothetical protein